MKVIDCTNIKETLEFDRETIMVMCFTPKIIVFETEKALDRFKRVWEEIIGEYLEINHDTLDPEYELHYRATWYVDHFEEESWMIDNDEHEGRKAKVTFLSDKEAEEFEWQDTLAVHFGVLNSGDEWTEMEVLKTQCELIRMLFENEQQICKQVKRTLTKETKEMFETILSVWEEDLRLHESGADYFKVNVEID